MHRNDRKVLEFFRDIIQPSTKIYDSKINFASELTICIDRIYADILVNWGFVQRKSLTLGPTPKLDSITDEQFYQLFVGIIEGDGSVDCIRMKSRINYYMVPRIRLMSGSSKFIGWIRSKLIRLGFKRRKITTTRNRKHSFSYAICGADAIRLHGLLMRCKYKMLDRKWSRITQKEVILF